MTVPDSLETLLTDVADAPRWWVAFSGGLDSTVLLHRVQQFARHHPAPPITAVHVHHGLQPAADDWARHCEQQCAALGLECRVVRVVPVMDGQGIEMAARKARYAAFEALLGAGDILLTAHHRDDQAETVLLRLLRGSGPAGLAGMPVRRPLGQGQLLRPLLDTPRVLLEAEARAAGLVWVDDPSNGRLDLDRNFLRHEILPRLAGRWLASADTLARGATWLREQVVVEQQALDRLLAGRTGQDRWGYWLDIAGLEEWPRPLRQALLRHWLHGLGLPMPSAARLDSLDHDLLLARDDARGFWAVGQGETGIGRFRDRLYWHTCLQGGAGLRWDDPSRPLALGQGARLHAEPASGAGAVRAGFPLAVRFRQGGERCHPATRAHSQTLKRLLQEAGLPPWVRDAVPLLDSAGTRVAVADCWVCHGFEVAAGQEGWKFHWEIPLPSLS